MIVTFNPMINTSATSDAAYANFLRCVTAACTAAVGAVAGAANSTPTSTNLSVVPYLNNTGSQDVSKNCIISVDANSEAGGWTISSAHNVPSSATFTAIGSASAFLYKADFYNSSGKASYPYNKLSFYACGTTSGTTPQATWINTTSSLTNPVVSSFSTNPFVRMAFGCSVNSAWTAGDSYTPAGGTATDNTSTQTTSWSLNTAYGLLSGTSYSNANLFAANNTSSIYKIAVTSNYCIVWQQNSSNSYASGYSNTLSAPATGNGASVPLYGQLMYGGLRETQSWENAYSNNPPWVAFQYCAATKVTAASAVDPNPPQSFAAYLTTLDNTGVASATATRYQVSNLFNTTANTSPVFGYGGGSTYTSNDLQMPPWYGSTTGTQYGTSTFPVMPTVDPATGTLVPSAYPIVIRRNISGSWNPGGAARGIYKSLTAPLSTLKLYWGAANQTFTIGNDQYIPVIFDQDMFLIRFA